MLSVTINGKQVSCKKGTFILQACTDNGIYVPTLCAHPDIPPAGNCGLCVVKVNGDSYELACSTKVTNGMVIETDTPEVKKRSLDALNAFNDMPLMPGSKEIEDIYKYLIPKRPIRGRKAEKTNALSFDPETCVNCGRCVRVCGDMQYIGALDEESHSLNDNDCIQCGMCTTVCPTDCLTYNSSISSIIRAMAAGKILVLQIHPSSSVSLGELFGEKIGVDCTKKIIGAAREIGFRYVFDVNFGGDINIIETAHELLHKLSLQPDSLPMFTSWCPAWVNFVEKLHPELIPNLSTVKSPHILLSVIIRNYYAHLKEIDLQKLFIVSLLPCTANKDEIKREQLSETVDCVLTTREFGELIKKFDIDWTELHPGEFDEILGESSGSAALYGVSGGALEATARYLYENLTGKSLGDVKYHQWRGKDDIREASVDFNGRILNSCVCNGVAAARELIESGNYKKYQFIDVVACPDGCIAGGGQPKLHNKKNALPRTEAIYQMDESKPDRPTPHNNKALLKIYDDFIGNPYDDFAQSLFHTTFAQQNTPILEMKRKVHTLPIVAFGSASGTASRYAGIFAGFIGTVPVQLNMVTIAMLEKTSHIVVFCSTFGDGEFPANAEKFVRNLSESKTDLGNLKYSICGLGSHDYPKYCYCGRTLDRLFMQHHAQRFMDIAELDSSLPDHGEHIFEAWAPQCVKRLGMKMPDSSIGANYTFVPTTSSDDSVIKSPMKPVGYEFGTILQTKVITPEGFEPKMRYYEIRLPQGMTYEAGDLLAVLPQNDNETVKAVLQELKLNGDDIMDVTTTRPEGYNTIPSRLTLWQLFSQYLDLNGVPSRNLIRAYKQFTNDQFARERYERLLDPADPRFYNDLAKDMSTREFILEYTRHGSPPLDVLVSNITHIRARLYCIASAPCHSSSSVELIISDNIFGPGNSRRGLCTSFMAREGLTKLAVRTQRGCFSYPKQQKPSIIMAALGCGVAPMLSLLQHRESLEGEKGDACLFFGCRVKNSYPDIDKQLSDYVKSGLLQNCFTSYSREGTTKSFITEDMAEQSDLIWNLWRDVNCTFAYCGPPRGIPEKIRMNFVRISMEKGGMSREEAENFCAAHPHFIESF